MLKQRMLVLWLILLVGALPLAAQATTEAPNDLPITYDTVVNESITDATVFDWWSLDLQEGDTIRVEMTAYDGLIPLIGIINDDDRELLARSDTDGVAQPDSVAVLDYRAPSDNTYRIVATRDGNLEGTTTGNYALVVSLLSSVPARVNDLQEVEFRCGELIATNALGIAFTENAAPRSDGLYERYALTVASPEGFKPAIRAFADVRETQLDCTRDGRTLPGSTFQVPTLAPIVLDETNLDSAALLILQNSAVDATFGRVLFNIGSVDGATGRFVAVLTGLSIAAAGEQDTIYVRLAPRTKGITLTAWVIADPSGRLDPRIEAYSSDSVTMMLCDDAGSRDCAAVPSARDLAIVSSDSGGSTISGDRFDAGVQLVPGTTDPFALLISSSNGSTTGAYSLVIVGELP